MAIAGTGWGARGHLSVFKALPGIQVVGIWGRKLESARQVAERHDIGFSSANFSEMLEKTEPDVVGIAVPPTAVGSYAREAIEAGVDVLMERCRHSSEALALQQLAEDVGVMVCTGLEYRFMDAYITTAEIIAQGAIGEVRHILHREAAWWRAAPDRSYSWWHSLEKGGGALAAMGTHVVDLLTDWIGPFQWVQGTTHTYVRERPSHRDSSHLVTADDFASFVACSAEKEIIVDVLLTAASPVPLPSTTLIEGSAGWLRVEMPGTIELCDETRTRRIVTVQPPDGRADALENHWQEGLWRIAKGLVAGDGKGRTIATLSDLAASLEIIEMISESDRTGARIWLNNAG